MPGRNSRKILHTLRTQDLHKTQQTGGSLEARHLAISSKVHGELDTLDESLSRPKHVLMANLRGGNHSERRYTNSDQVPICSSQNFSHACRKIGLTDAWLHDLNFEM